MNLIKIKDEHYVIVDDSWSRNNIIIKGDYFLYQFGDCPEICQHDGLGNPNERKNCFKITHSTQPLEYIVTDDSFKNYEFISLQEVKEIISEMPNGNKIDSMAEKHNFGELEFQTIDNRTPCDCHCHREPNTIHFMACCNNGMIGEVITKLKLK